MTYKRWLSPCGRMDLRPGDWRDVLADVPAVDVLITDPPYSERTARGFRGGNGLDRAGIVYGSIDHQWVDTLIHHWASRINWFSVVFSDHIGQRWYESAFEAAGLFCFAPVPYIKPDSPPRFLGDGPASQAEWITIARKRVKLPRERAGSRRGFYVYGMQRDQYRVGGKSLDLMRALVRDYTCPDDLIVDPCAGGGTTLLAAAIEGRRAIGAEIDPQTYDKACRRLAAGYTPQLPGIVEN